MSSNRNKNKKKNTTESKKFSDTSTRNRVADNDMDECDKLIEQLDEMEKKGELQPRQDMSSRVKNLIQSDKEAIRKMQQEMQQLEDDLDYLDDEKYDDEIGKASDISENKNINKNGIKKDDIEKNDIEKSDVKKREVQKQDKDAKNENSEGRRTADKDSIELSAADEENREEVSGSNAAGRVVSNKKNRNRKKGKNNKNKADISKTAVVEETHNEEQSDSKPKVQEGVETDSSKMKDGNKEIDNVKEKREVKLDFFDNMDEKDGEHYSSIRKQAPNRLRGNPVSNKSLKDIFTGSIKNMLVGSAIVILLIVLFVALALDSGKTKEDKKAVDKKAFLEIDTQPMIELIDGYYAALKGDSTDDIRAYFFNGEQFTDEEIKNITSEQNFFTEFISSDFLSEPFTNTECHVQQGLSNKEYIAYMKFRFTIKDCTEPATGVFEWYLIDVSDNDTPEYKIKVNSESSEAYRYCIKMKNCSNVKELFDEVNNELVESCSKDEVFRRIILKMFQDSNGKDLEIQDEQLSKIVDKIRKIEESESNTGKDTDMDDSTTQPIENAS